MTRARVRQPQPELLERLPLVDRDTDRWRRVRHAVGDDHAPYVDADMVADRVVRTVERSIRHNP